MWVSRAEYEALQAELQVERDQTSRYEDTVVRIKRQANAVIASERAKTDAIREVNDKLVQKIADLAARTPSLPPGFVDLMDKLVNGRQLDVSQTAPQERVEFTPPDLLPVDKGPFPFWEMVGGDADIPNKQAHVAATNGNYEPYLPGSGRTDTPRGGTE